ncbi:MAG: hypothetical protein KGJ59_01125 [Bacteroidota bacterium]|nr:hypothetical protein [Bacteroidota bacterium]
MPYTLETSKSLWRVIFSGTVIRDDLRSLVVKAEGLEKASAIGVNRLIDLRGAQAINIEFSDVSDFVARRRSFKLPNNVKSAFLTSDPVQFGFARMFQTILDHPQITVEVFENEKEALDWLMLPGD